MKHRSIVHLDADAFYAAVEQASDPKLRGKPVAVGGEKRGIIASASYEARRYGVYTPMPTARARKLCPNLIVLPGDFERYEQFSNWMFSYPRDFTPDVEQTSIDEGYFDLTGSGKPAADIAMTISKAINQKLKITVSEGIGTNKLVSAVASKLKKPAAFFEVSPGNEAAFLHPLPNKWLPGVGPKTSVRLNAAGLAAIHHVASTPLTMLELLLGNQAAAIREFAHGIDERPLVLDREPQKTFSEQETFARDLTDEEYVEAVLLRMADTLFASVRDEGRTIRTLTVRVRYNDMAEDQASESLLEPTDLETEVYCLVRALLRKAWKRRVSVRLVSLKLSNLYKSSFPIELPILPNARRRDSNARLTGQIDVLRKTHGTGIILRAHDMRLRHPPTDALVKPHPATGGPRNKGYSTTHFDMDAVEPVGLIKMDILAQGGLAVMRDVRDMLAKRDIAIDFETCIARDAKTGKILLGNPDVVEPWQDPAVWEMIAGGNARAVHHIESPAMTSLCRMCNVREIDGLVAIVSVIRPGAANEGKKLAFTRRYQGMEPIEYPHPSLEPCLKSTYGLVVYEEHILQICEAFAGLSSGRADVLRRALTKYKQNVIDEIRKEFIASALARGHTNEKIAEVWGLVTGFSGYAFCKAHSTAYGVEAYQSAWLKRYYPAEFMAAVLTNGKGFYDPLVYVLECHRLGLTMLPPDVNEPGPAFVPHGNAIRVPVTRVKGLNEKTIEFILEARKNGVFVSLADFFYRVKVSCEELESLIRAGAFDCFGEPRTRQFWSAQYLLRNFGTGEGGQSWLIPPADPNKLPQIPVVEPTRDERLQAEAELFGFAVSAHPLELYRDIAWDTYCPVNRLGNFVGQIVKVCGLVVEQRIHHQVTGEPMKFLSLADWTGIIETELFAKTYRSYGLATVRYPVLEIEARVEPFENGRGFTLRALAARKPRLASAQDNESRG
jgi:nucleotidyltransferase/DNA polymerase involved in DNA repair